MGGDINGALLPLIIEILGIEDIEGMLRLMRFVIIKERGKK
jgi:hypothetical protein